MKTLFTDLVGSNPQMRTIDFLLIHRNYDYSLTEIARNAGVGWTTINLFWKKWMKQGFVKKTRRIGRAQLYVLNFENQMVKNFALLHDKVLKDFLDENLQKEVVPKIKNLR